MHDIFKIIQSRKTEKYLSQDNLDFSYSQDIIDKIMQASFSAPFHYPCHKTHQQGELDAIVPWRIYVLDKANCRKLRHKLINAGDETKIPELLAAASHVLLVTWLPDDTKEQSKASTTKAPLFDASIRNMEHIAATSAAIQNMLIGASALDIPNYWSSGGHLAKKENLSQFDIPDNQILLGAVFLFPQKDALTAQQANSTKIVPGKWRENKGDIAQFSKYISV